MLSQFVVSSAVADEDFQWQLENSRASVLILLMDAIKSTDPNLLRDAKVRRQQFLERLFQEQEVWSGVLFEGSAGAGSAGAFLYRKCRVESLRRVGSEEVGAHRYLSVELQLKAGYQNPPAAVAVGVCFKVEAVGAELHDLRRSAGWPQGFITRVHEAVRAERVRFLGGVFDGPSNQAAQLGRSCGAEELYPFCQMWSDGLGDGGKEYNQTFHPSFIFVIGPANLKYAIPEQQPATPAWLLPSDRGPHDADPTTSALLRLCRPSSDIPKFQRDPNFFNEALPSLGDVKQKVARMEWWRPWIHQLLLYVGTARQGCAARRRDQQKRARGRKWSAVADHWQEHSQWRS